ncbi:MAG: VanZ family protein [Planctomycetales bacterium]|nr:VanZ family protein [Planctomycetales bacterium]
MYWIVMFISTHWPKVEFRRYGAPQHFDKFLHFSAYLVLAVLVFGAVHLSRRAPSVLRVALGIMLVIAFYGVFDEVTQPYFHRIADWTDWVADVIGTIAGLAIACFFFRRLGANSTSQGSGTSAGISTGNAAQIEAQG